MEIYYMCNCYRVLLNVYRITISLWWRCITYIVTVGFWWRYITCRIPRNFSRLWPSKYKKIHFPKFWVLDSSIFYFWKTKRRTKPRRQLILREVAHYETPHKSSTFSQLIGKMKSHFGFYKILGSPYLHERPLSSSRFCLICKSLLR
jgi:hypothetical protein